jgi:hypothetical protein
MRSAGYGCIFIVGSLGIMFDSKCDMIQREPATIMDTMITVTAKARMFVR